MSIVAAPGRIEGELSGPGASVVLVAQRAAVVDISIAALPGSSNLDAKFGLDLLDSGVAIAEQRPAAPVAQPVGPLQPATWQPQPPAALDDDLGVELMAHVARRGDVLADAEGWIGGPRSPSAVEGFRVACRGADIGIAAQITTVRGRGIWSDWSEPGAFVGSRQQANPITGVRLRLLGAEAHRYQLDCRALFLGSTVAERRGAEVEFSSFGTSDPVVGLAVRVTASEGASERLAASGSTPRRPASRVRVFR